MVDVSRGMVSKSDQLNALDLVDPLVIRIDKVDFDHTRGQPLWIYYNKLKNPWKPSLGMRKIIASDAVFGKECDHWIGKMVRIYNEPKVLYSSKETGGIRFSHATGIERVLTFPLRTSRYKQEPFEISPLVLSDSDKTKLNEIYGNINIELPIQPDQEISTMSPAKATIIQDLLDSANWDIEDFCGVMKVSAITEIPAIKYDKLVAGIEKKAFENFQQKPNEEQPITCELCQDTGSIQEVDNDGVIIDEYACSCQSKDPDSEL